MFAPQRVRASGAFHIRMIQFLVRVSDGLITAALSSTHAWGVCECWPSFVVLHVEGSNSAIAEALEENRDAGLEHVSLDSLSDQAINALARDGSVSVPLQQLQFSGEVASNKLTAATVSRAAEKVAFEAWHASLGAVGDAPNDPQRRAAEAAARAELVSRRGGGGGTNVVPPRKGTRT